MSVWRLLVREIFYHRLNFVLGLVAVIVAAGCVMGSQLYLKAHDQHDEEVISQKTEETKAAIEDLRKETQKKMEALNRDIKKATIGLGFTLTIMHKDVDQFRFQNERVTDKYLPEDYTEKLANSKILSINHLLPILQERVQWKELDDRTITIIGTRGEVDFKDRKPKPAMQQRVPSGKIVLGHELFLALNRARQAKGNRLGLTIGIDKLTIKGKELTIHGKQPKQGNFNDSVAFVNLADAQEMFDKKGLISGIFAVGCECEASRLATIRKDVTNLLKDSQVIEDSPKGETRAKTRLAVAEEQKAALDRTEKQKKAVLKNEKERRESLAGSRLRLTWVIAILVVTVSAIGLWVVMFMNVRQRRSEIGILRAIGLSSGNLFVLFLSKTLLLGLLGALIGTALGSLIVMSFAVQSPATFLGGLLEPWRLVVTILATVVLCCVTALIPSMLAAREDPALVLSQE